MASTTKNPQLDTLRALVAFARGLERDAKTQTDLVGPVASEQTDG